MSSETFRPPHAVGTEALLPFAENDGGRMVHVSMVPNGKKCGCICPECRRPLIAYHPKKKVPYFGHYPGAVCNALRAIETMVHKLAKQIIEKQREIILPPVVAKLGDREKVVWRGRPVRFDVVRVEQTVPGMRPDIIAARGAKALFIEIAVYHKVDAEKLSRIREMRQATIEIDLSKWRHETDEALLAQAILHEAPREWLFNALASEEEAKWIAEQDARATRVAEAINLDLAGPVMMEAKRAFARAIAKVEAAGLTGEVGVEIPGSTGLGVNSTNWQAMLLARLFEQAAVTVPAVLEASAYPLLSPAASEAYRDKGVDWAVVERITAGRMRDPRAAVRAYLDHLCERGVVTRYHWDQYVLTWDTRQRVGLASLEFDEKQKRMQALQDAFEAVSAAVGAPNMPYSSWIETRHDGLQAAPRELAELGGPGWRLLVERMDAIQRLSTPHAAVVKGGLLGFPAESHLADRVEDADRRRQEAEEREAARLADEQIRNSQQAYERLLRMRELLREAGEAGEALLRQPLGEIGGRSIEDSQGWMSDSEASMVLGLIRRQLEAERRRQDQQAKIRKWQAALHQRAAELLGKDRADAALRSHYPEIGSRRLIEYCTNELNYKECRCILERRLVRRRRL